MDIIFSCQLRGVFAVLPLAHISIQMTKPSVLSRGAQTLGAMCMARIAHLSFFENIRLKLGGEGGYFGAISIQRLRVESHTLENMSYLCPGMVHLVNQGAS